MEKVESKKIYQKKWFCILIFILICPIGLFLIWRNKLFNKIIRVLLIVLAVPYSFIGFIFWIVLSSKNSVQTNSINTPTKISESIEKDSDKVEENENKTDESKNINDYVMGESEFLELYVKQNKIEKLNFSDEKKLTAIENKLKNIDVNSNEFKNLDANRTNRNTIQEKFNQYKVTANKTNVMYIGDLKNNKPNGIGAVIEIIEYKDSKLLSKKYVGNFKDGYFNGYGKLYNVPLQEDYDGVERIHKISQEKDYDYINKRLNGLIFEGEFDNGIISGKGNEVEYLNLDIEFAYKDQSYGAIIKKSKIYQAKEEESKKDELENLNKTIEEGANILNNPINIFCGTYKNGQLNGNGKVYKFGKLFYDGEWKNNAWDGKGISYFNNSNSIKYKGEIKEGKADGKGTLYDKDGNVIYSGEFKNGDYK